MAKQVKSVRMNEKLIEVFNDYSALLQEMFGSTVSLSTLVNASLAEFLANSADSWISAMQSRSVVDFQPNGLMKHYEFTDEQVKRMATIRDHAAGLSVALQE